MTSSLSPSVIIWDRRATALLLLSAVLLCLDMPAKGQGPGSLVWASGPDLPSPRTDSVAILAPDNAILLVGGASPSGATVVPRLPNGAASWTTAPNLDITRIAPGAVRYSSTGILVMGGRGGNESTDEVLRYDYYGGDSQDGDKMSAVRQQLAFAADGLGRVYALGGLGNSSQALSSAERYNPSQDTWTGIAPLPGARSGATAVGVGAESLYVFGGAASGVVQATVFRYTIASNSWETLAPMPIGVRGAVAVLTQNRVYVIGGVAASGPVDAVQVLDLATGLWTRDTPLPGARYGHGAVIGAAGQIFVAGGYDGAGMATDSVLQSQRLNIPETAPVFTTSPVTSGSLDRSYVYQAGATGNPGATYALVVAPDGMSLDTASGAIAWQPMAGQTGAQPVTIRATNRVGFVDQSFTINVVSDTIAPTAPTEVQVVEVTASSIELAWSGAFDATGVDHYAVYRQYHCGFHGIKRCYSPVVGNIPIEGVVIDGLPPLTSFIYTVRAFDAAGNPSANSKLVSLKTLSPPVSFRAIGATSLPANFPLQLQFLANANPAATFFIVSGPPTLTLDPETGVASWIPTPGDVGTHTLVVRATNSGGTADLAVELTVRPDVPQLSVQFVQGAGGFRNAVAGFPWTATVADGSHTPSSFEIVSGPTGMTLDPVTGQIDWLPTAADAGTVAVMVRATNAASSVEISFEIYCHFTGAVTDLVVTGLTDLSPQATWSAPVGEGSDLTSGYTVVASARYRSGRTYRSHVVRYETDAENPTVTLSGLVAGRTYNLYVNAVDELANLGLTNSPGLSFVPRPGLPSVSWTVRNANGETGLVAGQAIIVQFTALNPAFGPTSYAPVNVPPGFSLNPVTGEGHWTPAASDVGTVSVIIRATNLIGSRDLTITLLVRFSGPVQNPFASRNGNSAAASWNAPVDNVFPIASYRVTMHWQWSSRSYSRPMTTNETSLAFGLSPTGAVWHKGVTITPLDASGNAGVTTPLIPYNGALPIGLPAADPAWIEQTAISPDGTPVLEIRGPVGAVVEAQVSNDLLIWDSLETVTVGDEGVIMCPDPQSQNAGRGFYRLVLP